MGKFTGSNGVEYTVSVKLVDQIRAETLTGLPFHKIQQRAKDGFRGAITHLVMALTNGGIELDEAGYIMSKDNAKWLEAFADAAVESGNEFGAKEAAMTSTEDGAPQVTAPKASKTLKAGK